MVSDNDDKKYYKNVPKFSVQTAQKLWFASLNGNFSAVIKEFKKIINIFR